MPAQVEEMTQAEGFISTTPQKRRKWPLLIVGVGSIALGAALLVVIGLYYGFGLYSTSQLDKLNAAIDGPVSLPELPPETAQIHGALLPDGSFKPINRVVNDIQSFVDSGGTLVDPAAKASKPAPPLTSPVRTVYPDKAASVAAVVETAVPQAAPVDVGALVSGYNAIYPGFQIHPKNWADPLWASSDDYTFGKVLRPDGYTALSPDDGLARGQGLTASRITIPAIAVDSAVKDLAIIDLGDSRGYETPKHVVGRIPQTSNPGEQGNGWFFGHLESPIKGEGNVFSRLPEIPGLLKNGDPVYVSILSDDGEYLYQVTATQVVHQDDLRLYETDSATITLVACVPRLVYDHRILVTGKLVGVKRG